MVLADSFSTSSTAIWITLAGVLFTGVCSIVAAILVSKTRVENASQHLASQDALKIVAGEVTSVGSELRSGLQAVGTKIDTHIGWHLGHDTGLAQQQGSATIVNIQGSKETV